MPTPNDDTFHLKIVDDGEDFLAYLLLDGGVSRSLRIHLTDISIASRTGRLPYPVAADMLDIGVALQTADRMCLRAKANSLVRTRSWSRRIHVQMAVRLPELWGQPRILELLGSILGFLTDDDWSFKFVSRSGPARAQEQSLQLNLEVPSPHHKPAVVLFGGGVDSTFGLWTARRFTNDAVFALTITNNRRVSPLKDNVLSAFSAYPSQGASSISLNTSARLGHKDNNSLVGVPIEGSSRARAIQFLMTGVALALNFQSEALYVAENGVGAISLPMTSDHFGSRAPKGMHPLVLDKIARLAQLVSGHTFSIVNLGLHFTKGQMIAHLAADPVGAFALSKTSTCDRKKLRGLQRGCGACTSCLLRQVGFAAAGVADAIRYNQGSSAGDSHGTMAFQYQASKIESLLRSASPLEQLVDRFPQIDLVRSYFASDEQLLALLNRHVQEVHAWHDVRRSRQQVA